MKDPVEIAVPSIDCGLVFARMECPGDPISFTTLDDLPLDLGHSPTILFVQVAGVIPG